MSAPPPEHGTPYAPRSRTVSNPLLRAFAGFAYFPRMNFSGVPRTLCAAFFLAAVSLGCWQPAASPQDEQKDPYFLVGRNRVAGRDYGGAMEAFRHALENNPNSSAAHFELALLNEQHERNFPAAIYHWERYLALNPQPQKIDIVKQHITLCTQELIKKSGNFLTPPSQQREIEELRAELQKSRLETEKLRRELEVALARAGRDYVNVSNRTVPNPVPVGIRPPGTGAGANAPGTTLKTPPPKTPDNPGANPNAKTHTVKAGESPATIAKQNNISVASLLKANPNLDPKRMRIGQVINLPPKN